MTWKPLAEQSCKIIFTKCFMDILIAYWTQIFQKSCLVKARFSGQTKTLSLQLTSKETTYKIRSSTEFWIQDLELCVTSMQTQWVCLYTACSVVPLAPSFAWKTHHPDGMHSPPKGFILPASQTPKKADMIERKIISTKPQITRNVYPMLSKMISKAYTTDFFYFMHFSFYKLLNFSDQKSREKLFWAPVGGSNLNAASNDMQHSPFYYFLRCNTLKRKLYIFHIPS